MGVVKLAGSQADRIGAFTALGFLSPAVAGEFGKRDIRLPADV